MYLTDTLSGTDPKYITTACEMVAEMVESLQSVLALGHKRNSSVPAFLTAVLKNIVVSLARLPLVNSYTRVPPLVSLLVYASLPEQPKADPHSPSDTCLLSLGILCSVLSRNAGFSKLS